MRSWLFIAPPFLDGLLAFAERVDRHRRHVRPVTPGGVIGVELTVHAEEPVVLRDGARVEPGDRVLVVHFRNDRIRQVATSGWNAPARRVIRDDFAALARWADRLAPAERPAAYRATTILDALLRREGWYVLPRPRTLSTRLDDWFMRWLLVHWSRGGRARLARDRPLVSVDAWLSAGEFRARYGWAGRPREGSGEQGAALRSGRARAAQAEATDTRPPSTAAR